MVIASIFEFLGALILGAGVTDTVRSGITDFSYFYGEEDLLLLGMFSALISTALWLYFATKWSLPVSTTQGIVGSIIGFTVVEKGTDAVQWDNVYQIIIWWIGTPLTGAIFAILLFSPLRHFLLRRHDAYQMVIKWWPFFIFIVIFVSFIFVMEKGVNSIDIELEIGPIIAIAFGVACVAALLGWLIIVKTGRLDRFVQMRCKEKLLHFDEVNEEAAEMDAVDQTATENGYGAVIKNESDGFDDKRTDNEDANQELSLSKAVTDNVKDKLMQGMNVDILADLSKKEENIRNEAEKFDPQCEEAFAGLQVLTATFAILAHGSNDVANAVAPFAGLLYLFNISLSIHFQVVQK